MLLKTGETSYLFEITTDKGVGTKFLIRLPLTLAIAQSLIVKLKDQEMAVPMSLVEETTRFSYKDSSRPPAKRW
jgi:two-component system chemotaxis sensor kinase CheA